MIKRSTGIQDAGASLIVDAFHRKVTVPATERVIGVVGDHCSEQVTFQLPRKIDNHDMLSCPIKYVAWRNVNGETGTDELVVVESDEDKIIFGWTIRDRLAIAKGLVDFSLHFERRDPESGAKQYSWGTFKCTECEILDSVNAALGAYAAIYIDGEALVFADYTPVHEGAVELQSCVVPEGELTITEEGRHDVGRYAYALVDITHEPPIISVEAGVVTATANGMGATHQLETPTISQAEGVITATANGLTTSQAADLGALSRKVSVHITQSSILGFSIHHQEIAADGALQTVVTTSADLTELSLQVVPGSYIVFNGNQMRVKNIQSDYEALCWADVGTVVWCVPDVEGPVEITII